MSTYSDIEYKIPIVDGLKPVVESVSTAIGGISASLDVISTALSAVAVIAKIGDAPVIAFGEVVREGIEAAVRDLYDASFCAYHLYPSAPYNVLTYKGFLDAAETSLTNTDQVYGESTRAIVWLLSGDTPDELTAGINAVRALFGQAEFEAPPTSVLRDRTLDHAVACDTSTAVDLIPELGNVADGLLEASGSLRDAGGIAKMTDNLISALAAKADGLKAITDKLQAAVDSLDAIGEIEIKRVTLSGFSSNEGLVAAIRAVDNAPNNLSLVAGSIFVYDSSVAAFIEGLL